MEVIRTVMKGKIRMNQKVKADAAGKLAALSKAGVSPYHMTAEAGRQLAEAGYQELSLKESWELENGGQYFVNVYGTTCIAFRVNPDFHRFVPVQHGERQQLRIGAAHTDWPCLRIKSNPQMRAGGCLKLNAEVYGGPIYNTWFDRPLSIAGKVSLKGKNPFAPRTVLIDLHRPVAYLPNLAIHLNREVNQGSGLNPQVDLLPILGMEQGASEDWFTKLLLSAIKESEPELEGVQGEDILGYDLYVYVQEEAVLVGMKEEFLSAPRIDNLTSCQSCLEGILSSSRAEGIDMIVLFDNEECGSRSKQGADSNLLSLILEKMAEGLHMSRQDYLNLLFGGICLSVDVAHGKHPNHPEKSDVTGEVTIAPSVVVKLESNQRYATDSAAVAVVGGLCRERQIPVQYFCNRSDIRGGSTLGSLISAWVPVPTADIGVPILAMHSARELMAAESQSCMDELLKAFFS